MKFKFESIIDKIIKDNSCHLKRKFIENGSYFDFIFLCGKKLEKNDNRYILKESIFKNARKIGIFAEDIYYELKDSNFDSLVIEEIIFNICNALIIIVESYGSACELGAFSLKNKTLNKVWVIDDVKFKDDASFIQTGPIAKIKKKFPDHICYESFKDGSIEFNSDFVHKIRNIGNKKTFKNKPFYRKKENVVIRDLSFLTYLIFDYIRIFKVLVEENLEKRLKHLFEFGKFRSFKIELPSSNNHLLNPYQVSYVFKAILKILYSCNILNLKSNKGFNYYTINYKKILDTDIDPRKLSSLIFTTDFLSRKSTRKILARLYNLESKEGFNLYDK